MGFGFSSDDSAALNETCLSRARYVTERQIPQLHEVPMVAFHQMVALARLARGLLAGRDGEEVIADVRALPVADPAPTLRTMALMAILTVVAFGCFRAAGGEQVPPTAALHEIRASADL